MAGRGYHLDQGTIGCDALHRGKGLSQSSIWHAQIP